MAPCGVCKDFFPPNTPQPGRPPFLDISYDGLRQAATENCRTCSLIAQAYEQLDPSLRNPNDHQMRISDRWLGCPSFCLVQGSIRLAFRDLKDSSAEYDRPGFENYVDFIQRLREECVTQHKGCRSLMEQSSKSKGQWIPTRLVHVGEDTIDRHPRLFEHKREKMIGDPGRYIALSHCWGKNQIITTTSATYEERRRRILWTELSKTFQDAITVTRALGIEYIWIDSLCIIQDDEQDWATEAASMVDIYSNAYLTIAATSASSGEQGFFWNELPSDSFCKVVGEERGLPFDLNLRSALKHTPLHHTHGLGTARNLPLLKRAWTLQEQLLSPHMIHFTQTEMLFECFQSYSCECGSSWDRAIKQSTYKAALDPKTRASSWVTILEEYTTRKLTIDTDRLPALSGIARAISSTETQNLGYAAGLFIVDMPHCLLWMSKYGLGHRPTKSKMSAPPSWSWASVESMQIFWPTWTRSFGTTEYDTLVQILDVQCDPTTVDAFGMVSGGRLTTLGKIYPLDLVAFEPPSCSYTSGRQLLSHAKIIQNARVSDAKLPFSNVVKDIPWESLDPQICLGETLYFLPVIKGRDGHSRIMTGLMLRAHHSSAVNTPMLEESSASKPLFERIAYATIEPEHEDAYICQEVTIV